MLLLVVGLLAGSCDDSDYSQRLLEKPESDEPYKEFICEDDVESTTTSTHYLTSILRKNCLCIWDWNDLSLEPRKGKIEYWCDNPILYHYGVLLADESIVTEVRQDEDSPGYIVKRNLPGDIEYQRWEIRADRICQKMYNTRNGKYIVLYYKIPNSFDKHYFGIIKDQDPEITWFLEQLSISHSIYNVALSEDGKYMAAVGSFNGGWILVADTEKKAVLWKKVPYGDEVPYGPWTVNFNGACFSPDSSRIYVAGNTGLFCFETASGKILSQWPINGRFVSVDVSPDSRWVAGGTVVPGDIYLYEAQTGKLVRNIKSGQYTVYSVTFSPDSTLLASSGVDHTNVKIWKVPAGL